MASPSRRSTRLLRPVHDGPVRAVAYLRVSTAEQVDSGAGLDAQRTTVVRETQRRDWELVAVEVDAGASGKSLTGRPALDAALDAVRMGRADVLVVAKLDRLSRSVADFAALLDQAQREGWGLVALDLGVDTTTPAGELVANVMAAVAQWERRTIGQRTREGLAAKRASGVRLGRPPVVPAEVVMQVLHCRSQGLTLQAIADELNAKGVPTARGTGPWRVSSVAALMRSGAASTRSVPNDFELPDQG